MKNHLICLGRIRILFLLTKAGTCWYGHNDSKERVDELISFQRVFWRQYKEYVYRLTILRLSITFAYVDAAFDD